MVKVELHPAFFWICPECAATQYQNGISGQISEEKTKELLLEAGLDPELLEQAVVGQSMFIPTQVTCKECNRTFESVPVGLDDGLPDYDADGLDNS